MDDPEHIDQLLKLVHRLSEERKSLRGDSIHRPAPQSTNL